MDGYCLLMLVPVYSLFRQLGPDDEYSRHDGVTAMLCHRDAGTVWGYIDAVTTVCGPPGVGETFQAQVTRM
jgi:hypothetical protein